MSPRGGQARRLVGYLALLVVGVWLLSKWDTRQTDAVGAYVEQAESAIRAGKAFRERLDSLRQAAQKAQERAHDALRRANVLSASLATLEAHLPDSGGVPRPLVDSLLAAAEQRDSLRLVAIAGLMDALQIERLRGDSAEARAKKLEELVAQSLTVVDCRILGVGFFPRCPSRLASLGIGVGLGAAAVVLAH